MSIFSELNEKGIPKFFWYTVSFCLIFTTASILWLMFKSQSVNIEIASTKIQMIHALSDAQLALEDVKKVDPSSVVAVVPTTVSSTRPTSRPTTLPTTLPSVKQIEQIQRNLQDIRQGIK